MHPAAETTALVSFDEGVDSTTHIELLAPDLIRGGSQFLEFCVRYLEVVLVDNGFVVEEECHC